MKFSHALLYGVLSIALLFAAIAAGAIGTKPNLGDNSTHVTRVADNSTKPAEAVANSSNTPSAPAASIEEAPPPPPTSGVATTSYYGGQQTATNAAWAAEATMNTDYKPAGEPAAAAAPAEPAVADTPPPPTGGIATTSYYGDQETPKNPAWASEAAMNADYKKDEPSAPPTATPEQAAADAPPPPMGGNATTSYYGDQETPKNPAWASEAVMNADYKKDAAAAAPTSVPEQAAADAPPPPMGGNATTSYYGDQETPKNPAWASEAAMNADYKKDAAASAPSSASEPAVADAPPPPTGGNATTSYYGGQETPKNPAWASEAAMNGDYKKVEKPSVAAMAAASPAPDASLAACRSSLTGEVAAAKINFNNASAEIDGSDTSVLEKVAAAAKSCGNVVIEVAGYTDNVGDADLNKELAEERAQAVVAFLKKAGVDAAKMKAVGYGQEKPVASNDTPKGRRENRRIEFRVMGQ